MSDMPNNYYDQFHDLHGMILRAYVDTYTSQQIEQNKANISQTRVCVLGYVNELLKYDLALTVWKICFDPDSNANTIQHLHNNICGKKSPKPKLTKRKALEEDIKKIRDKYLAHNDTVKSDVILQISDLIYTLDELRDWFNQLCDSANIPDVEKITDELLEERKLEFGIGINCLIYGDSHA